MIWQPHITTSGEWYAAKVLQGIFGAPMESIAEITVSDVVSRTLPLAHTASIPTITP